MAHMIDGMAFVGQTPWHGLGAEMPQGADLDKWRIAAGLGWSVQESLVQFQAADQVITAQGNKVLWRDDTKGVLGVVSDRYNVVQPAAVVDFYKQVSDHNGFKMETMGSLAGGKRIWALANVGDGFSINGDVVKPYLLFATSYDKSLATRVSFTTVRVVCNNTLQMSVSRDSAAMSIPHSTIFDGRKVAINLGLLQQDISAMRDNIVLLSDIRVSRQQATRMLADAMFDIQSDDEIESMPTRGKNILSNVVNLFDGQGIGSDMQSAAGTAWGMVNALTQFTDHIQGNSVSTRLNSAWFGVGANSKAKLFNSALRLAA